MVFVYRLLVLLINLATKPLVILYLVLQAESVILKSIPSLNLFPCSLVFFRESFRLLNHAVDFLLRQTALVVGDRDRFCLSGALIAGCDFEDAVGVEFKGYFDLRNAAGSRWDTGEFEFAEEIVVFGHGAFALDCGAGQ